MHRAKKRFGQNFLHDQGVIQRIVSCIAPQKEEAIVEIGPGLGALTEPVLSSVSKLSVIELDKALIPQLNVLAKTANATLNIIQQDALTVDFTQFGSKLKVYGNLPYNISTPLLFHLFQFADVIGEMTFMLQKEVVHRLCATPNSKLYGQLSVIVQYLCHVDKQFDVGPGAFTPAPKVDSSVVKLRPRSTASFKVDYALFAKLVKAAFANRRKTLKNNLKQWFHEGDWAAIGVDSQLRAEALSVETFVRLTEYAEQSTVLSSKG